MCERQAQLGNLSLSGADERLPRPILRALEKRKQCNLAWGGSSILPPWAGAEATPCQPTEAGPTSIRDQAISSFGLFHISVADDPEARRAGDALLMKAGRAG